MGESGYKPYFDPDYESLIERIHPPRVCIDNETCKDCTLVKVDSANKHGILLEMVQVLTDLNLLISKSYISSDGGWFMDVFHVTDQLGNKLTDDTLIHYIQQSLCAGRRGGKSKQNNNNKEMVMKQTNLGGNTVGSIHLSTDYTALEMTATDRPGLLSELSAVLTELGCNVAAVVAWTHNTRAACIFYVEDESKGGGPITDPDRVIDVEEQLENVVGAHHHGSGERRMLVRLVSSVQARIHTERRLHQLMYADRDYDIGGCGGVVEEEEEEDERRRRRSSSSSSSRKISGGSGSNGSSTDVSIETCKEKGYSVVNVRSKDRPKLLFDTVCTLTDMEYVVFHAAISSRGSVAVQEYYIRHVDGCTMNTEGERRRVTRCLVAAAERRVAHGLRLDVCTRNRVGLLSDITRVFRENGLSVSRANISTRGEKAIGSFYVTDASSGKYADPKTVELVRNEIGSTVLEVNKSTPGWSNLCSSHNSSSSSSSTCGGGAEETPARLSFGSLLWAQLERLSGNFGSIKS